MYTTVISPRLQGLEVVAECEPGNSGQGVIEDPKIGLFRHCGCDEMIHTVALEILLGLSLLSIWVVWEMIATYLIHAGGG